MLPGIQGALAAASIGLGCGTCCGSGISTFLFSYLTTHARGKKDGIAAFFLFYLGKILAVTAICSASSLAGRQIMDEDGSLFGFPVHRIFSMAVLGLGCYLVFRWIREKLRKNCGSCHHCGGNPAGTMLSERQSRSMNPVLLIGMGIGYGASPCAPLLLVAGLTAVLPVWSAAATGGIFALSSGFFPAFLLLLLSGVLSQRLRRELPQYLDWFRLFTYLLLIGIAGKGAL